MIEKFTSQEQSSENKEKLLTFEKSGDYVFHGSADILESLEPRQAYNRNEETGEMKKDGDPSVFATPYAEVAIFRALTIGQYVSGKATSEFGINEGLLYFSSSRNLLERAKSKTGKVYVLKNKDFIDTRGMECISHKTVLPHEVVEVHFNDLPQNIKIVDVDD